MPPIPEAAHLPSPLQTAMQRSPIFHTFVLFGSSSSSFCLPLFSGGAAISRRSPVMCITSSRSFFSLSSSSLPGSFVRAASTYAQRGGTDTHLLYAPSLGMF